MIPNNWREELLSLADNICAAGRMKRTVLSNKIAGDADFLDHLANQGGCTTDKYYDVLRWLTENQPEKINGHNNPSKRIKKSRSS